MKFKKGDTVIYPQHGACKVEAIRKEDPLGTGKMHEYLILKAVIGDMVLRVPMSKVDDVGVRPPVSPDELADLVAVLAKPDPRVPSNWSRRFKNHQEKLKSGDVYQVAEVVRNLSARNRDASLSAAERTMYERARVNLISEIAPALKVSPEEAERYLDDALAKGVLKVAKAAAKKSETSATPESLKAEPKKADSKPTAKPAATAKKGDAKPAAKKAEPKKAAPAKKAEPKKAASKPVAKKAAPATKPAKKPVKKPAKK